MSFVNAALASLAFFAAVPLIIHLLNRTFPKLFPFSSIENIRKTVAQRSKLYKWRHWIMMLIRIAFLLLLAGVFMRPIIEKFGKASGGSSQRQVAIVIDHSLSMEYAGSGVPARREAVQEAAKIIDTLDARDTLNIFTVSDTTEMCFVALSSDHAQAKRFLEGLEKGLGFADFNLANATIADQFNDQPGFKDIYYISDFQRKNWANVDFTGIPADARMFYVQVGQPSRNNRSIQEATFSLSQVLAGDTVMLEVTVGNFSDQPFDDALSVVVSDRAKFEQQLYIAPWSTGSINFPVTTGRAGLHLVEVSLPKDDLEEDNRFFLTLPVLEKEHVVIMTDEDPAQLESAYFIQMALNPFEEQTGSLLPRIVSSSELSDLHLASARKLFISGVGKLSPETCDLIQNFVFNGGGAIYFLDGRDDIDNCRELDGAFGGLPLELRSRRELENVAAGGVQIIRGDFKSPFLEVFRGPMRQNLALVEFYDFYYASASGKGNILLSYSDGSPALAEHDHGLGTLLLMNFSVSERSSNLARQKVFPAWIQDLVKKLNSTEPVPSSFVLGQPMYAEVWKEDFRESGLLNPVGEKVAVDRKALGGRYSLSFIPGMAGFYIVGGDEIRYAYGVNCNPGEGDLRSVDRDRLPQQEDGVAAGHFIGGKDSYEEVTRGRPIFQWVLLAACAILAFELLMQLMIQRAGMVR